MSGLEKFTHSASLSTPSKNNAAANLQQESGNYGGNTIKVWNDFSLLKNIGSEPVISHVEEAITIRRQGEYYQKRLAWGSFKTGIHVVILLRPLTRQEDNKLKTSGEWFIDEHTAYTPTTSPKVRKGKIKNSYAKGGNSTAEVGENMDSSAPTDTEYAISLLPTELQTHINQTKRKGLITLSAGASGIADGEGRIIEENVRLALITEDTALVIHANRKNLLSNKDTPETAVLLMNQQDWSVEQYTYSIAPQRHAVEGKKRQGIEA